MVHVSCACLPTHDRFQLWKPGGHTQTLSKHCPFSGQKLHDESVSAKKYKALKDCKDRGREILI